MIAIHHHLIMPCSWSALLQKCILLLSLTAMLVLLCVMARRRLGAYEEQTRARRNLLYEIIANVSDSLDQLEAGLDDIAARVAAAKTQVAQFASSKRQNLLACAFLRARRTFKAKNQLQPTNIAAATDVRAAATDAHEKMQRGKVT